ncbi:amidase signature enzyme [Nemania abortiva]|nr:amidase signature enzyme [Nemania abortiva]
MLLYENLYSEGCVFYARTAQPQTIMHLETNSNVYGSTINPYNRNLTSGGSTGGESALLGLRGSILDIGGDIGGSIRCPAAHVGIYGFKYVDLRHDYAPLWDDELFPSRPSNKVISSMGLRGFMAGKEAIMSSVGPMCLDREGLELFMRVALTAKPWHLDPSVIPKTWTSYKFDCPLKIAVQWWDGVVQPHPPMARALREVTDACRKAGMTVVDWDCVPLNHAKGWDITAGLYWPDGGKDVLDLLAQSGEPVLPLTKFIIEQQPAVKNLSQPELWKLCAERDEYRAAYARVWTATSTDDGREVDVILCPPNFGAATPHDQSRYWGYTSNWNLLDYPAAVFPVTVVDPEKDPKEKMYTPKNEQDRFVFEMYAPRNLLMPR